MVDWISVKDRLPVPHVFVLVFFRVGGRIEKGFCESMSGESGVWDYCDNQGGLRYDATHWMPMPDAPDAHTPRSDDKGHYPWLLL